MEALRPTPEQAHRAELGGELDRIEAAVAAGNTDLGALGFWRVVAAHQAGPRSRSSQLADQAGRIDTARLPRPCSNPCSTVGRRRRDAAVTAAGVRRDRGWPTSGRGSGPGVALRRRRRGLVGRLAPAGARLRRLARRDPLHRRLPRWTAAAAARDQDGLRDVPARRALDARVVPRERRDRDQARAVRGARAVAGDERPGVGGRGRSLALGLSRS